MSVCARACACTFGHPEKDREERGGAIGLKKCDALLLAKLTISMLIKAREQEALECELSSVTTTLIIQRLTRVETASGEGSQEKKDEGAKKKAPQNYIYDAVGSSESNLQYSCKRS